MTSHPPPSSEAERVLHELLLSIRQWLLVDGCFTDIGAAAERALFDELPSWKEVDASAMLYD